MNPLVSSPSPSRYTDCAIPAAVMNSIMYTVTVLIQAYSENPL